MAYDPEELAEGILEAFADAQGLRPGRSKPKRHRVALATPEHQRRAHRECQKRIKRRVTRALKARRAVRVRFRPFVIEALPETVVGACTCGAPIVLRQGCDRPTRTCAFHAGARFMGEREGREILARRAEDARRKAG